MKRIGIVGCAGTGKSALARVLAERLGVPLLESKLITQDILNRDGYDYASGIQIEQFLASTGRQNEILRRTMEQQEAEQFVTDRTVIDLAAYSLIEMHGRDPERLGDIFHACRNAVKRYTHIILCPICMDRPMDDNQKRTLSPWYQRLVHLAEVGIMTSWGIDYVTVVSEETAERAAELEKVASIF